MPRGHDGRQALDGCTVGLSACRDGFEESRDGKQGLVDGELARLPLGQVEHSTEERAHSPVSGQNQVDFTPPHGLFVLDHVEDRTVRVELVPDLVRQERARGLEPLGDRLLDVALTRHHAVIMARRYVLEHTVPHHPGSLATGHCATVQVLGLALHHNTELQVPLLHARL